MPRFSARTRDPDEDVDVAVLRPDHRRIRRTTDGPPVGQRDRCRDGRGGRAGLWILANQGVPFFLVVTVLDSRPEQGLLAFEEIGERVASPLLVDAAVEQDRPLCDVHGLTHSDGRHASETQRDRSDPEQFHHGAPVHVSSRAIGRIHFRVIALAAWTSRRASRGTASGPPWRTGRARRRTRPTGGACRAGRGSPGRRRSRPR